MFGIKTSQMPTDTKSAKISNTIVKPIARKKKDWNHTVLSFPNTNKENKIKNTNRITQKNKTTNHCPKDGKIC